jgi:serine/threonine protein kinase
MAYQGMRLTANDCKNAKGVDLSLQWQRDVMEAVSYFHQHRGLHRGIKCDNVLLRANMPPFASRC